MKKETIQYFCDVCKKEFKQAELKTYTNFPVVIEREWTAEYEEEPHIEFIGVDMCNECAIKATNLTADFQGSNLRFTVD